ncbi:MAG: GTP-binding protein EngB [Methanotrichaceae archaeon]
MTKEIVFVGRSNVGKSTLFSQIAKKKVRIGRKPGVTLSQTKVQVGNVVYVDMPGYGFMRRVPKKDQERIKDFIVHYFEDNHENILLAIQIIDTSAFMEIVRRWERCGEIPLDIELFEFLSDLGLDVVLAANKMDKVSNPDQTLDQIVEQMGMLPPWRQWIDKVAPICAKKGEIDSLLKVIRPRLQRSSRGKTDNIGEYI